MAKARSCRLSEVLEFRTFYSQPLQNTSYGMIFKYIQSAAKAT